MSDSSCQYCNLQFNKRSSLARHQENCNRKRIESYECKICYSELPDTLSLKNHIIECSKNTVNFNTDLFDSLVKKIEVYKSLYIEQKIKNSELERQLRTLSLAYNQNIQTMNSFLGIDTSNMGFDNFISNDLANNNSNYLQKENIRLSDDRHKKEIEKFKANFNYEQIINTKYKFVDNDNKDIVIYQDMEKIIYDNKFVANNRASLIELLKNYLDHLNTIIKPDLPDISISSFDNQVRDINNLIELMELNVDLDTEELKKLRKKFRIAMAELVVK
jgi:hypothetical protein